MATRNYLVTIEDDGGFLAIVPDLPGCMTDGPTRESAARSIEDAITSWIDEAKEIGREIPQPRDSAAQLLRRAHRARLMG